MSKIVLDTNAYVALDNGLRVVKNAFREATVIVLPIIVLGELYYGFERGSRREDNIRNLNKFLGIENLEILYTDNQTARIYGEIAAELADIGKPMQQNDIWIAALTKQRDYILITGDTGFRNIKGLDSIIFDPKAR